jgi:hypothetical protein
MSNEIFVRKPGAYQSGALCGAPLNGILSDSWPKILDLAEKYLPNLDHKYLPNLNDKNIG